MKQNIFVILVRPQIGQNIGAVARAMKNFSLNKLRLVSPRDGWPNPKADELAVGAIDILQEVEIFDSLEDAIADLNLIYGASARSRFLNKEVLTPEEFANEPIFSNNHKIGILLGPENNGLANEDISYVNKIISIPVNPSFQSLNIAQSAIILFYELFKKAHSPVNLEHSITLATQDEINGLFHHLEQELDATNFFKVPEKKEGMVNNIRSIFKRIVNFSGQDVRTLRGIFRSLQNKKS